MLPVDHGTRAAKIGLFARSKYITLIDHKNRRVGCPTELLEKRRAFSRLKHLMTRDESWVLYTFQSSVCVVCQPIQQRQPKPNSTNNIKSFCVWWSVRGIEYWELLNERDTVTASLYVRQLATVKEELGQDNYWKTKIFFQQVSA